MLNKASHDYYIGSASTGKFHAKLSNHLFNFSGSKVIKNAVKKHGISCFAFIVLELFPDIINKENNKKLLDLEDFYIKSLLPNYNILTEASLNFGYKHNETARLYMESHYSKERRLSIANSNIGRGLFTAIEAMGPLYLEQYIQDMKSKYKAILLYNMDYTVYGGFSSIIEASKFLSCSQKTIIRALQTPKKILKRR